jgi:hypothetical protein
MGGLYEVHCEMGPGAMMYIMYFHKYWFRYSEINGWKGRGQRYTDSLQITYNYFRKVGRKVISSDVA